MDQKYKNKIRNISVTNYKQKIRNIISWSIEFKAMYICVIKLAIKFINKIL